LTVSEKIRKLLVGLPDIKPKQASELLKIPYSNSFRQIFYSVKKEKKNCKKKGSNSGSQPLDKLDVNEFPSKSKSPSIPPKIDDPEEPLLLTNLDTIAEMEKTIQLIKDPNDRATQLSRLHTMKLKPIANKEKLSLKELLDGAE